MKRHSCNLRWADGITCDQMTARVAALPDAGVRSRVAGIMLFDVWGKRTCDCAGLRALMAPHAPSASAAALADGLAAVGYPRELIAARVAEAARAQSVADEAERIDAAARDAMAVQNLVAACG